MKRLILMVLIAAAPLAAKEYKGTVTDSQRRDIHYLIQNMAPGKIHAGRKYGAMTSAGDRVKTTHPLDFLQAAIDEESIGNYRALRDSKNKKMSFNSLWHRLEKDTVAGLKDEADANNLSQHLPTFAKNTKIPLEKIEPLVKARKFEAFMEMLADNAPLPKDRNDFDF